MWLATSPAGPWLIEQTEIMALDMRDQHLGAGLGKSRGQINHETTFSFRSAKML